MAIFPFDRELLVQVLTSPPALKAIKSLVEKTSEQFGKKRKLFVKQDPLFSAHYYGEDKVLQKNGYLMPLPYVEIANFVNSKSKMQFIGEVRDEDFSLNSELTKYGDEILTLFKKKKRKTYDDYVLRVADIAEPNTGENVWRLVLQQTTYFDAVKTNFTLDYPLEDLKVKLIKHGTNEFCKNLREFEVFYNSNEVEWKLKAFKDSQLANLIGVSCILYLTSERKIVISYRKKDQAIFEKMPGPSSSGTVKYPMTKRPEDRLSNILQYLEDEMLREIAEEIKVPAKKIENIVPLAFCRELIRGGLPQFFFLAESAISWEELKKKAPEARDFHFEFDKIDWDTLLKRKFEYYSENNQKLIGAFINPELTTNLLYAHDYLSQ